MLENLPPISHPATSEELRLRVVAQTNGENAALGQRAMTRLFSMDNKRRIKEERERQQKNGN